MPTFFEEGRYFILKNLLNIYIIVRIVEEGKDIVGEDIGIGVGPRNEECQSKVVSSKIFCSEIKIANGRVATYVFSRRLTIQSFSTGESSSGNSIFPKLVMRVEPGHEINRGRKYGSRVLEDAFKKKRLCEFVNDRGVSRGLGKFV